MIRDLAAIAADPLEPLVDVAAEIKCSTRFLKDEAKKGRLKIIKLSYRTYRVRRSDKLRYLASREVAA